MWASHKNSFLQLECLVPPRTINRSVQKAREVACCDEFDNDPPFNRMVSMQPPTPINKIDRTRISLAFGRRLFSKIKRNLGREDDIRKIMGSLNTLADMIMDPEKAMLAVKFNIINTVGELLYDYRKIIREKAFMVMKIFAYYNESQNVILKHSFYVDGLKHGLEDEDKQVRIQAIEMLEMLAKSSHGVDQLVELDFIPVVLGRIVAEKGNILKNCLQVLKSLIYCNGKCISLQQKAHFVLVALLSNTDHLVVAHALECLMLLTSTKQGKILAYRVDLLKDLVEIIFANDFVIQKAAVGVLMNCTLLPRSKIAIIRYRKLPERLIQLCSSTEDSTFKLWTMQTLTNMAEHPAIRKLLQRYYSKALRAIKVAEDDKLLVCKKTRMLSVVDWTPDD